MGAAYSMPAVHLAEGLAHTPVRRAGGPVPGGRGVVAAVVLATAFDFLQGCSPKPYNP